jgi:hypothetical protein
MIEMRWYVPVTGDKVLQYRQMVDATVYAQANALTQEFISKGHRNMQWSPWKDVPMESERNPDFP